MKSTTPDRVNRPTEGVQRTESSHDNPDWIRLRSNWEAPEIRPGSGRQADQVSDLKAELESLRSQFEAQGKALAIAHTALHDANNALNQAQRLITRLSPANSTLSKSAAEHARNSDPTRAGHVGTRHDVSDDRLRDQEGAAFSAVVRATCRDMPETQQSVVTALARAERNHEGR
jgi:hypothetical protein